jgi:hypothetical protein
MWDRTLEMSMDGPIKLIA